MNQNQTESKPSTPEQPTDKGLDDADCSSSALTGGGLISNNRENEPRPMPSAEGYPEGWMHCKIHLNPATGEMHSDGDHRVRHWLQSRLDALKRIEGIIIGTSETSPSTGATENDHGKETEKR